MLQKCELLTQQPSRIVWKSQILRLLFYFSPLNTVDRILTKNQRDLSLTRGKKSWDKSCKTVSVLNCKCTSILGFSSFGYFSSGTEFSSLIWMVMPNCMVIFAIWKKAHWILAGKQPILWSDPHVNLCLQSSDLISTVIFPCTLHTIHWYYTIYITSIYWK